MTINNQKILRAQQVTDDIMNGWNEALQSLRHAG